MTGMCRVLPLAANESGRSTVPSSQCRQTESHRPLNGAILNGSNGRLPDDPFSAKPDCGHFMKILSDQFVGMSGSKFLIHHYRHTAFICDEQLSGMAFG